MFAAGREYGQFQLGRQETAAGRQRPDDRRRPWRCGGRLPDGRGRHLSSGRKRQRADSDVEREKGQRRIIGRRVGFRLAPGRDSGVQRAARPGQRVLRQPSGPHRFDNAFRHIVSREHGLCPTAGWFIDFVLYTF